MSEAASELAFLRAACDATRLMIVVTDDEGNVLRTNRAMDEALGREPSDPLGMIWSIAALASEKDLLRAAFDRAGENMPSGMIFHLPGPHRRIVDWSVSVLRHDARDTMVVFTGMDLTDREREDVRVRSQHTELLSREQRARRETEEANVRLVLIAEAGKALARSLRLRDTLDIFSRLVTPSLADWCLIVLRRERGGELGEAGAWATHGDPENQVDVARLRDLRWDSDAAEGPARVIRTGNTVVYSEITDADLTPRAAACPVVGTRDPEQLHLIRALGMRSLLCVPITGRSGVDAVAMLVSSTNPRRYGPADVMLAEEFASRAAASLENGRLLDEALDAVRARDEFLSVAAHELRTPLTSLLLRLQLVESEVERAAPDRTAMLRGIQVAEQQARRLARLVDTLLDVSRAAEGRPAIATERFDLARLVRDVLAALTPELQRAGCALELTAAPSLHGTWDRTRLEQLITNLVSNAIKFGSGRPIEVNIDGTDDVARLSVRDHGMGISEEDQARIFGRFERAVSTRHFGGLGLGLYVSASIVRAHGGTLRVESSPGNGAHFIVELPRDR